MAETYYHEDDTITGKAYDARLVRRLWKYVRPHIRYGLWALGLVLLSTGLFLVSPRLLGIIVDSAIRVGDRSLVMTIAGIYLGVELLRFGTVYAQSYLLQVLGQHVMYDLRTDMFEHLQGQSVSFFERHPVGRLVTRSMNDVQTLAELFATGIVVAIGDVFLILGIAIVLIVLDPVLGLLAISVVPVLIVVTFLLKGKIRDAFRDVRKRLAIINSTLAENLSGMAVVQLFAREEENLNRFSDLNDDHLEAQLDSVTYHALFSSSITILSAVSVAVVLWYGGGKVLQDRMALGVLVSFIAYVQHLYAPIRDISEKYNIFQSAMASAERIFKLLDTEEEIPTPEEPVPADIKGEVAFEGVWFRYPTESKEEEKEKEEKEKNPWVLKDVSFRVEKGESIAIVGATGAGKSTVIKLLGRFYDVQRGAIKVDGIDIREYDPRKLRRRIGVVHQDVFLFSGDILENVRLWEETIDLDTVQSVSETVEAADFIEALPDAYQSEVKERGATLSAGQRQLLSFARALATDPAILILDEATASVDTETEARIQEAIENLVAGRTSIIIAHRLSTIRHVDRILVFHKGKLREEGTHDELMEKQGIYHRLYELQFAAGVK